MILVKSKYKTLAIYAERVSFIDYFKPSVYAAFDPNGSHRKPFFMVKSARKTIWIDLLKSDDEILMDFKSNTRNEVRKAIREGCCLEKVDDINEFVDYYNAFAREKGLGEITAGTITKYPHVLIYKSSLEGKPLTMHASIVDNDHKIVRLLYSASVRFDEGVDRKSVGLSNRFLHYMELLEFKKQGLAIYDFGGINEDENDREQYNITTFKKGFGGKIIEEFIYTSISAWLGLKLAILLSFRSKH